MTFGVTRTIYSVPRANIFTEEVVVGQSLVVLFFSFFGRQESKKNRIPSLSYEYTFLACVVVEPSANKK